MSNLSKWGGGKSNPWRDVDASVVPDYVPPRDHAFQMEQQIRGLKRLVESRRREMTDDEIRKRQIFGRAIAKQQNRIQKRNQANRTPPIL